MSIDSLEQAIEVYHRHLEREGSFVLIQPANTSDYDHQLGGWLLENANGPLALVRDNGTIAGLSYDEEKDEVVIDD